MQKGVVNVAKGAELLAKPFTESLPVAYSSIISVARMPAVEAYRPVLQGMLEKRIISTQISWKDYL